MNPTERRRVLLVEDDASLGPLMTELLRDDFDVTLVTDGQRGLHAGLTQQWDAMIIDRGLPVVDGIDLVAALRRHGVATPVLMLTALGATSDVVDGLDAGANDYMSKPFEFDELTARLRALTRSFDPAPSTFSIGGWDFDPGARIIRSLYGDAESLSAKESRLLAVFAAEPERVFSRAELLERLETPDETPGVVDTYVHYLRKKISKSVIRTVHGLGYQLGEP